METCNSSPYYPFPILFLWPIMPSLNISLIRISSVQKYGFWIKSFLYNGNNGMSMGIYDNVTFQYEPRFNIRILNNDSLYRNNLHHTINISIYKIWICTGNSMVTAKNLNSPNYDIKINFITGCMNKNTRFNCIDRN